MNASNSKKFEAFVFVHAAYLFSKIEDQITAYAHEIVAPPAELTRRVVELFQRNQTIRQQLGSAHPVLSLSGSLPKGHSVMAEATVDASSRETMQGVKPRRKISAAGLRAIRRAQRTRWAKHKRGLEQSIAKKMGKSWKQKYGKPHWTQTAVGRKKLAKMNRHRKNGKMGPLLVPGRKAA